MPIQSFSLFKVVEKNVIYDSEWCESLILEEEIAKQKKNNKTLFKLRYNQMEYWLFRYVIQFLNFHLLLGKRQETRFHDCTFWLRADLNTPFIFFPFLSKTAGLHPWKKSIFWKNTEKSTATTLTKKSLFRIQENSNQFRNVNANYQLKHKYI